MNDGLDGGFFRRVVRAVRDGGRAFCMEIEVEFWGGPGGSGRDVMGPLTGIYSNLARSVCSAMGRAG